MSERVLKERRILGGWVRASWGGWLLGVPLIVVLALLGEAVGIGGAQFLVGAGMGASVGFMQGRALRGILPTSVPWFLSCAAGLAALDWMLRHRTGSDSADPGEPT